MNIRLKKLPDSIKSTARAPLLSPEATPSLLLIEQETGGLAYKDFWRCATSSMMIKRLHPEYPIPGYSTFNYGLSLSLDLPVICDGKDLTYTSLLNKMEKNGWYCYRKDATANQPGSEHFIYLGENPEVYLEKRTLNPDTWRRPGEDRIYEKYGTMFSLSIPQIQSALKTLGFYHGDITGVIDLYFRESVLSFQRAWNLTQDGTPSITFQRVLAFVSASIEIVA